MENINKNQMKEKFSHSFVADLVYFEGSLISLFEDSRGFYLYCWSDSDSSHNRWIVIPMDLNSVMSYLAGLVSLKTLFTEPPRGILYLLDLDKDLQYDSVYSVKADDLPHCYVPGENSFFTPRKLSNMTPEGKFRIYKRIVGWVSSQDITNEQSEFEVSRASLSPGAKKQDAESGLEIDTEHYFISKEMPGYLLAA